MSVTNSKRISKTASAVDYELYGARGSAKYKKHKAEGTNRVAAMRCDANSPEEFVARAEALAKAHGRKIESRSLIQSFLNTEFDPEEPEQVQAVNDFGYEYAKRLHPDSDVLVITHCDGAGGHPHNHIKVINHNNRTGKALTESNMHWRTQKVNDELMRDHQLSVAERGSKNLDQRAFWEHRRLGNDVTEFDQRLGDAIEESLADPRTVDLPAYRKVLEGKGIELEEKVRTIKASADGSKPEHESVGWTYKALDTTGEKPRKRRRKASSLSDEFTREGAQEIFDINKARSARHGSKGIVGQGQDRRPGTPGLNLGAVDVVERVETDAGGADVDNAPARGVAEQRRLHDEGDERFSELHRKLAERRRRDASTEQARGSSAGSRQGPGQQRGSEAAQRRDRASKRARLLGARSEARSRDEGRDEGMELGA